MTREIAIGSKVMDRHGVYAYGGPAEHEGMVQVRFDLRHGGLNEIHVSPDAVAPAELEETVNLKDPRISVVKHDKKPGYWAAGPWAASIEGGEVLSWHKTKKAGVEDIARRLVIKDWHAQEEVAVGATPGGSAGN